MLYAVLCYNSEDVVNAWSKEKDDAVMAEHLTVLRRLSGEGKLGPVARLMPTKTARTLQTSTQNIVVDGPFAETKEQLLGFYILDCSTLEEAIAAAQDLMNETGCLEIRAVRWFHPGGDVK